jgi:gluconolactonase
MEALVNGYTLIEGPVWDPARGLLWSDVHEGGVHCLGANGAVTTVIEHRRGIGGIALHERGGLVIGGRNIAYKGPAAAGTVVLLDQERAGGVGFNDLTTDEAGRIYVGSLGASPFDPQAEQKTGFLHVIDLDGSSRVLHDGIRLTNGLGFSPDGHRLYHSDSRAQMVGVYDVHDDGSVGPRRVFARVEQPGVADGLAVAEDGSVWVAVAGGGVVRVFDADGSERPPIAAPLPMVTSLCFGGDDLRDLYVVTGSVGAPSDHSGTVYRLRVEVPGLPVPLARVALDAGKA